MAKMIARPTIHGGVHMRSRLEAGFAMWLDDYGIAWEYEPRCFSAPEFGQWLPDFLIKGWLVNSYALSMEILASRYERPALGVERVLLVDVKPKMAIHEDVLRWQSILNANAPEALAVCACPGNVWRMAGLDYSVHVAEAGVLLMDAGNGPWQGDWWTGE